MREESNQTIVSEDETDKKIQDNLDLKDQKITRRGVSLIIILISIFLVSFITFFVVKGTGSDQVNNIIQYQSSNSTNSSSQIGNLVPQYKFNYTSLSLPTNFPKDISVYPNSTLILRQYSSLSNTLFVTWESKDQPDQITNYYKTNLAQNGWTNISAVQDSSFTAKKGNRTITITTLPALKDGGSLTIEINGI